MQISIGFMGKINEINKLDFINFYSFVIIISYIWSIFSWQKLRKELLSPYILFLTTTYIFTAGQCFLWAFNVGIDSFYDLRLKFSYNQIFEAQFYTGVSLTAFHLGAIVFSNLKKEKVNFNEIKIENFNVSMKAIRQVGGILFLIAIIPTILVLKNQLSIALTLGYTKIYDQEVATGLSGVIDDIALYIIPALICLMIGYSSQKLYKQQLPIVLASIYIIIYLVIGLRSKAMVMLLTVAIIWHYCIKRIKGKQLFISVFLGYCILSFLNVVSQLRSMTEKSFGDYYSLVIESFRNTKLFINTISGMGWSMFPLIKTMEIVPQNFSYRFGTSYLYSFTTIIPNLGFWDVHPAMKYSDLSTWLTKIINFPYGTGYSIVAEAYINFSWFGPVIMFVIGAVISRYFTKVDKYSWKNNPEKFVLMIILFSMTVMTVRNNFISTVRAIFYYSLPTYFMIYLIKKQLMKKTIEIPIKIN
jgi:oligosaccharide repeat unit polymerase